MPGVLGIELGLAWSATPVGWSGAPEVLARVLDGSAAAARLARELPGMRAVPGRRPDERVIRLAAAQSHAGGRDGPLRARSPRRSPTAGSRLPRAWTAARAARRSVAGPQRAQAEAAA